LSNWIPNSFQLPNALVDDKYLVELKGSALAMYILIVRKTRGWQKECDRISLSQFTEFTGYNKDAVLTGVNKLVDLGLVKRTLFENRTSFYELNDQPLPPENFLSENPLAENQLSAVGKSAKLLSENQTHNNKENNSKKTNISSDAFDEFWNTVPNKDGKATARKSFEKALKKKSVADLISSYAANIKYCDSVKRFYRNPTTWLNQEGWDDESIKPFMESQQTSYHQPSENSPQRKVVVKEIDYLALGQDLIK